MNDADVCVVGGGLAGLSATYFLSKIKSSLKIVVLESSEALGGLLRTVNVSNFFFDVGGSHIIFSKNKEVLNDMVALLNGNYLKHRRNTKIYYKGNFVKYPFEVGLKDLLPEERLECLRDIVINYVKRIRKELRQPTNFLEWIRYVFGDSIAEKYLIPYNQKLWKVDLREISLDWVGGRVPNPPIEDVMKAAAGIDVEGYIHQLNFYYPRHGGIEALINALKSRLNSRKTKVLMNSKVTELTKSNGSIEVIFTGGRIKCRSVIYTAPLNRSSNILRDFLGGSSNKLNDLRSIPLAVVGVGLKGGVLPYHWIYFPESNYIFHRVAFISNYSPYITPEGYSSIIAEITFPSGSDVERIDSEKLVSEVVNGLVRSKLIDNESRVILSKVWVWKDAYIIYDRKRSAILKSIKPSLEEKGIFLHGRFGSWDYLNMDAVYKRSRNLALEVARYVNNITSG